MKRIAVLCAAVLGLTACAKHPPQQGFVLDGPALFVAAEYAGTPLEGAMERKSMVGIGEMFLASPDKYLDCRAEFNAEPTNKARIRGVMICTDKHTFSVTLRNLGPDQGVGVGLEEGKDDMLVLFYHPSPEEARRRLVQAAADMRKARSAALGLDRQPTATEARQIPAAEPQADAQTPRGDASEAPAEPQKVGFGLGPADSSQR